MTKKQRIIAEVLKTEFGANDDTAKRVSKHITTAIKPKPGAPGSFKSADEPPDDGGTPKGPGGH